MKASVRRMCLPVAAFAIGACAVSSPRVSTPAADPSSSFATTAPPRRLLGEDETTQKTHRLLAAAGATDLAGLKPMNMEGMEGMDHSSMGMEHSPTAEAPKPATSPTPARQAPMDHSQHGAPAASPAPTQATPVPDAEHAHTSEPEKSDASKVAPDAPQPKPAAAQKSGAALPAGMDHSNH